MPKQHSHKVRRSYFTPEHHYQAPFKRIGEWRRRSVDLATAAEAGVVLFDWWWPDSHPVGGLTPSRCSVTLWLMKSSLSTTNLGSNSQEPVPEARKGYKTSRENSLAPKEITRQVWNEAARQHSHESIKLEWTLHLLAFTQAVQIVSNWWNSYGHWVRLTHAGIKSKGERRGDPCHPKKGRKEANEAQKTETS